MNIEQNKRAQRALGPSPEEKVKSHSGAIYRGPLMLYTKYQGSSRFLQERGGVNFDSRGITWLILVALGHVISDKEIF